MRTCIKHMWNILIVNYITNSCIWNTCVTWQGIDYTLPEDDTIVSKHVEAWNNCAFVGIFFFPVALRPNAGHGPFIHEVSRSHTRHITVGRTPLDAWSVRRRDLYLTTHNRQTSMPPGWIRTHNLSRRAAADPRLRPRGHWDRLLVIVPKYSVVRWVSVCIYELNYPIRFVWNSSFVVSTTKQRLDLLSSPWDRECVDYKKKILIFFFRLFTVFFFALLLPRSLHLSLHLSVIMTQLPASFVTR